MQGPQSPIKIGKIRQQEGDSGAEQTFDLAQQRIAADAQGGGGFGLVAAGFFQRLADQAAFESRQFFLIAVRRS